MTSGPFSNWDTENCKNTKLIGIDSVTPILVTCEGDGIQVLKTLIPTFLKTGNPCGYPIDYLSGYFTDEGNQGTSQITLIYYILLI